MGILIVDNMGSIYETYNVLINEVFFNKDLMSTAYYNNKLPYYYNLLANNKINNISFMTAYVKFINLINKWNVKGIMAYNVAFDTRAINATMKYILKEQLFFPPIPDDISLICLLQNAKEKIIKTPTYINFCRDNNFLTSKGNIKQTAEIVYRFFKKDLLFEEKHRAIDDCYIEAEIFKYLTKMHKKNHIPYIQKKLYYEY